MFKCTWIKKVGMHLKMSKTDIYSKYLIKL